MDTVEMIVRGVCVRRGRVLLCRSRKGVGISYLPGGHIEFRETARAALAREMQEELGLVARVGGFLGCCEHSFLQKGEPHAEINLVFRMTLAGLLPDLDPPACEAWISFFWQPLDQLEASGMEPSPLRQALVIWLRRPGFVTSGELWEGRYPRA